MGKKCGIYCIENTINHKKYIGLSKDIESRWRSHRCRLKNGLHVNTYLQYAWNKYGADAFTFYILEECDEIQLEDRETYYITHYSSLSSQWGYNISRGGNAVAADVRSVIDYRDGTVYETVAAAARACQRKSPTMISWCNKHRNYMWHDEWMSLSPQEQEQIKCVDWDVLDRERLSNAHKKENYSPQVKANYEQAIKRGKHHNRTYEIYCPELQETFWGPKEAKIKYGINACSISRCLKGALKHAGKHPITGEQLTWVKIMKE